MTTSTVLKKILIGTAGAVFITGFAVQEKAVAVGITVLNSGFESPHVSSYTTNDITSWQASPNPGSSVGVFNITGSTSFNQGAPEGSQVAYSNGGTISQTVSANLAANTTYTLSLDVGSRNDIPFPGYNVELLAGNTVLASGNSVTPAPGTFAPISVTYTTSSSDALLGQPLTIGLLGNNGGQTEFDNVTLNATSTPVPFEFSPGLGILALGALAATAQFKSQVQKWKLKT